MKKLFILSALFSLLIFSCNKEPEPEPEPEEIRAFCYMYHFVPGIEKIIWVVDDHEVPDPKVYAGQFQGSVLLETTMDEFNFTVKNSGTGAVLVSEYLVLEKDKYYTIIVTGTPEDPAILINEIITTHPQAGKVQFQILNSVPGQESIDVYMGGSTADKKVASDLNYKSITLPFEAAESDVRAAILVSAHSEAYHQDSVLLSSIYIEEIQAGANYFSVVAPYTYNPESELTFWLYNLPLD